MVQHFLQLAKPPFFIFQDALVRNNYDEAAQAAASALKEIDAFKRAQSNAGIRNRCMDQDELVLINSMTAGFKIFVTIAQVELKQISIHQVVLAQLKNQIVMAYGSKIFLGMFRLVCENLTLLFLRGNYFRLARMFLLLTFQYYADIEMNKDRERIFFERIGIRISTVYKVGMESAKVKSELIYLMDLFDISQVHYNQGFEISDIIIANESIFDGLLEEMKVKCTSYQVPIFIKSPAQAKALYALINRKLELMKFNYEQLDPNDPVIKVKSIFLLAK